MITAYSNRAERRAEAARTGTRMLRGANRPASNPRRNAARKLFRDLRRNGVRVRRPADLRLHLQTAYHRLGAYLSKPVVVEHEGTVQS